MAGECYKPKKVDPPAKGTPKGDKGKADKGKSKGETGDSGKGKPQVNKVEAATNAIEGKEFRKQQSNSKEPEVEPEKHLEVFQKMVIKHMKEKEKINNPIEDWTQF